MERMTSIFGLPYVQIRENATWKEYVDVLEKALIEHPEDEQSILRALLPYSNLAPYMHDRCIEVADRLLLLTNNDDHRAEALVVKAGVLLELKKDLELAEDLFLQAHNISKDYANIYEGLIQIYVGREDFDNALLWAERMIAEEELLHLGLEEKGSVLLEMNRLGEALEAFETCLKVTTYPTSVHYGMARCHLMNEDHHLASEALIKAFETCHYPEPHFSYGAGYSYQQLNDPYRAMKWYSKTLDIDPSHISALNNMAVLCIELEEGWNQALPYLLKAVELSGEAINPSMHIIYRNLWAYHKQILDTEKAEYYHRLVLKCTGFDDDAIDFLDSFGDD